MKTITDELSTEQETEALNKADVNGSAVYIWLLSNGFRKVYSDPDWDCVMRLHTLHFLFWSDNLKHFSIGVLNDTGKKEAGGFYKKWNRIMLPKPIYTIEQAQSILTALS